MTNAQTEITITAASQTWTYDRSAHTNPEVTVTEGQLLAGDTLVAEAIGSVTNVADTAVRNNPIAEGYRVMHGEEDVTDSYVITPVAGRLAISPKTVIITTWSAEKPYDGTALTESGFTATPLEEGDPHVFTVEMTEDSTITNVGTQPNVIATVDGVAVTAGAAAAVGNYTVITVNGQLTITKDQAELIIESATNAWTYDGEVHRDETYTVTWGGKTVEAGEGGKTFTLENGDVLTITPTASGVTNVSDNAENNNTYTYTIRHGGTDARDNYASITANAGTL
ncbi:MAG: hypothetical protein IJI38_07160, partial [Clostridia bacterium]|nr:hypothetical protein [Clostridia bacterium]